jgi:hypothetical protein
MTAHALTIAGLVCFIVAAVQPALPAAAQGIKLNLTALGLALVCGAAIIVR